MLTYVLDCGCVFLSILPLQTLLTLKIHFRLSVAYCLMRFQRFRFDKVICFAVSHTTPYQIAIFMVRFRRSELDTELYINAFTIELKL